MRFSTLLVLGALVAAPAAAEVPPTDTAAELSADAASGGEGLVEGTGDPGAAEAAPGTGSAPEVPAVAPETPAPEVVDAEPTPTAEVPVSEVTSEVSGQVAGTPEQAAVPPAALPEAPGSPQVPEPAEAAAAPEWPASATVDPPPASPAPAARPQLGALGYDEQGQAGRIHLVVRGDTLWDISDAYLGTPWVWPSIWQDNRGIRNPHLIHPGDRIWITPTEMRRVTANEAERLMAGHPAAPEPEQMAPPLFEPEEEIPRVTPVAAERVIRRVSDWESAGLITDEQLASAASIVGATTERTMLSQEDFVYIGLGEGDVQLGEEFSVFRTRQKVYDPDTGQLLGHHVQMLGWVEVVKVHPETAIAEVRRSRSEIERGDRLMAREHFDPEVAVQSSPVGVEGKISFFPDNRVLMGMVDYVYLNRGALDGLEVGSPLQVYRPGGLASEPARGERVRVPDRVVGELLVVRTQPETSVALVTRSDEDLALGDNFRGSPE